VVARTYYGLGPPEAAIAAFNRLAPFARQLLALRAECAPMGLDDLALGIALDDLALGIALDGLRTAAFHFTRRPYFYHELDGAAARGTPASNGRLTDRREACAVFDALTPYADALMAMQATCRPFGRDYMALSIARQALETAAFHFTGQGAYYGARADSAGPVRPGGETAP
jgi:hypothetical protein